MLSYSFYISAFSSPNCLYILVLFDVFLVSVFVRLCVCFCFGPTEFNQGHLIKAGVKVLVGTLRTHWGLDLSLNPELIHSAAMAGQKAQRSSCLCLPSARVTGTCCWGWLLSEWWGPKSGLHADVAALYQRGLLQSSSCWGLVILPTRHQHVPPDFFCIILETGNQHWTHRKYLEVFLSSLLFLKS